MANQPEPPARSPGTRGGSPPAEKTKGTSSAGDHKTTPPAAHGPGLDRDKSSPTVRNQGHAGQDLKGLIDKTWEEHKAVKPETSQKANDPSPGSSGKDGTNARLTGLPSQTERCQDKASGATGASVASALTKGAFLVLAKELGVSDKAADVILKTVGAEFIGKFAERLGSAIQKEMRCAPAPVKHSPGFRGWN